MLACLNVNMFKCFSFDLSFPLLLSNFNSLPKSWQLPNPLFKQKTYSDSTSRLILSIFFIKPVWSSVSSHTPLTSTIAPWAVSILRLR